MVAPTEEQTYHFAEDSDSDLDSENLEQMEYEYALQMFAANEKTHIRIIERRFKEMCLGIRGKRRIACDAEEEAKQKAMNDELIQDLTEAVETIKDYRLHNNIDENKLEIEQPTRYVTIAEHYGPAQEYSDDNNSQQEERKSACFGT